MRNMTKRHTNSCYFELRKIAHLRPLISEEATKQLVIAFVISKLDYCNSLFCSMTNGNIEKLQKIQNHAARLIKKVPKRQSITPVLKDLHWLPVKARFQYKTAIFVYQSLNDELYPSYMKEMLTPYVPSRPLRSSVKKSAAKTNS